jgi:hypothetical protein
MHLARFGAQIMQEQNGVFPPVIPQHQGIGVRAGFRPNPRPGSFLSQGSCARWGGIGTFSRPISSP